MFKKFILISVVSISYIFANISTEQQNTNARDKSIQKSFDKTKSREKSKQITSEKGYEFSRGKEVNKQKEREYSISSERSKNISKSKSFKRTVEMPATLMMPEVDYLLDNFFDYYTGDVRNFILNLPMRESDLPKVLVKYIEDEEIKKKSLEFFKGSYGTAFYYYMQEVTRGAFGAKYNHNMFVNQITAMVLQGARDKYNKLFNNFFKTRGLPYINLSARSKGGIEYGTPVEIETMPIYIDATGSSWIGNFITTITDFKQSELRFLSKKGFNLIGNLIEKKLIIYKNNKVVIESSNDKIAHYYGDLLFIRELNKNDEIVIDKKIGADGINLSARRVNYDRKKFDSYFKKLMKLYQEAFSNIDLRKQQKYSLDEIKYLVREYLYKKIYPNSNDFLEKYTKRKDAFWMPKGVVLKDYPQVSTQFNDIIFSKREGIILNRRIVFQIEDSNSVQKSFNRLLRNTKTKRFAMHIKKAINEFNRKNRQDLARLTMQLAKKIAVSKNSTKKMDLISKAGTSTEILKELMQFVK